MARVEVIVRFFYEDVIYADTIGYLPRHEAFKISELKVEENFRKAAQAKVAADNLGLKQFEDNDDEMVDENDEDNLP